MKFFAGGLIKKNLKQCQKDQKISQKESPGGIRDSLLNMQYIGMNIIISLY